MAVRKANPIIASKYFPKQKTIDTVRNRKGLYCKNDAVLMDAYKNHPILTNRTGENV